MITVLVLSLMAIHTQGDEVLRGKDGEERAEELGAAHHRG
jgi:hypothetical protein